MSRGGGIARAATLLAALTAVSHVLGFLRDAVIAAVYGASAALDAYLVAQGLMNMVLALGAGAVARALVPVVSRGVASGDQARANRTVQSVATLALLVLATGAAVMYAAAETVVTILAPGFDAPTRELAAELARVVLIATVFVAGTDILAAAAQANRRFFASGFQGVPFNLVLILAALALGEQLGIHALAIGFVVGSILRLLVQFVPLSHFGLRLRPRLDLKDDQVRETMRLVPALLVTTGAVNINTLVDRAVGSAQGEGVITALNFGWRVVTLVDSLLVVTLVAALYPALGAAGSPERRAELRALVTRAVSTMLALLTPVVALLILLGEPIVRLLFGRGAFDESAVRLTAAAVTAYAVSAVAIAVRSLASRACLAVGDSRALIWLSLIVMGINVVGDLTLGVRFGVTGLAASTSLALLVGATTVVWRLRRRHSGIELGRVAASGARSALATLTGVTACLLLGVTRLGNDQSLSSLIAVIAATTSVLLVTYVVVMVTLRGRELDEVFGRFRRHR